MKFNELVNTLAQKAGLSADDEHLKIVLSDSSLDKDIPDEVWNPINEYQSSLLNVESAKSHPDISKYFKSSVLDGVDKKVSELSGDLTAEQKSAIESEQNSYRKIELLNKFLKDNLSNQSTEPNDEIEKYKKLAEDFRTGWDKEKTTWETERQSLISDYQKQRLQDAIKNDLSTYNYAKHYDRSDAVMLAEKKFNDELAKANLSLSLGDNGIEVLNSEGSPAYQGTEKISYKTFLDKAVNGYVATSDPAPQPQGNPDLPFQPVTAEPQNAFQRASQEALNNSLATK